MKPSQEMKKKIENTVEKINGCWVWSGSITKTGYAILSEKSNGGIQRAYRVSYEVYKGKIPKGLQIDHLCRNRACVNPDHLEAVTQKVNILRGVGCAALNARKTKCPRCGGEYLVNSRGFRYCLFCTRKTNLKAQYAFKARKKSLLKIKTLKAFKEFLAENCYDITQYGHGEYDKKIYDWFNEFMTPNITKGSKEG